MYNKPITSRIKRSPLLKYSPLKEEEDPKATVYGSEKGEDKITTKIIETPKKTLRQAYEDRGSEYKDLSFEEYSKVAKADPLYGTSGGKQEVITKEPGEDIDYEGKLYTKEQFDVFQPWETRRMSRSIKKEQRDIRRAKEKLAKAKEGTPKYEEAKAELAQFEEMANRGGRARASGKKTGTSGVYAGQREMGVSEYATLGEQKEQILEKARREARDQAAEDQNITTSTSSQAAGAVEPGSNTFDKYANINADDYKINFAPATYNLGSGINKMESPAKKALVGKQYNLPQHLQEKIKAAPGKMKTPLKKGYFKNK